MAAIETRELTKYYGETRGVEELSFSVEEGEVFGFLGPNGAGKTTTIRTLLGFQSPTSGTAEVLGTDIRDRKGLRAERKNIGFLPGEPVFEETVTGRRLIDYYASLRGDERSEELLEMFDPPLERKIGEYSRGNRQMLAIVIAFMHDPELLVMDEPTSGLDPLKQERFYDFVWEEKRKGKTFFFSSHILGEVRKICDRVGILRNGELVEVEDVQTLLDRSGKTVRLRVRDASPEDFRIEGAHDVKVTKDEFASVNFTYTGGYNALVEHLQGFDILELDIEEAPLEDVFLRFYGDKDV
ncbi:MAG: ABC transporter ATP-binding protein [Candidatus Nanohaloarchaea archaeon]